MASKNTPMQSLSGVKPRSVASHSPCIRSATCACFLRYAGRAVLAVRRSFKPVSSCVSFSYGHIHCYWLRTGEGLPCSCAIVVIHPWNSIHSFNQSYVQSINGILLASSTWQGAGCKGCHALHFVAVLLARECCPGCRPKKFRHLPLQALQ